MGEPKGCLSYIVYTSMANRRREGSRLKYIRIKERELRRGYKRVYIAYKLRHGKIGKKEKREKVTSLSPPSSGRFKGNHALSASHPLNYPSLLYVYAIRLCLLLLICL